MALAGPQLALHPTDEEDVNFFDHLADDLGQTSDELAQNFEVEKEGEVSLEEALSKLCHHGDPNAARTLIIGDQIFMQERVPNRELYFNPAVATVTRLMEATSEMSDDDAATFVQEVISSILEERGSKLDMPSADKNADAGHPGDVPLEEEDLKDHALIQGVVSNAPIDLDLHNHAVENAGSELATSLSTSSQSLQSNFSPPASSQPAVKELQWSIFSKIYTPVHEPNALNDFLSELDVGTEEFSNLKLDQPAFEVGPLGIPTNFNSLPSEPRVKSENLAYQNLAESVSHFGSDAGGFSQLHDNGSSQLHDSGGYGFHPQVNTQEFQVKPTGLVFSSSGTREQPLGESSVEQGDNGIETSDSTMGNHNTGMNLQAAHDVFNEQKQEITMLSTESGIQYNSLGDAQLGGSYTSNGGVEAHQEIYTSHQQLGGSYTSNGGVEAHQEIYSSHQQTYTSQSWESIYPGWYFDYATNEWKQIEGWDFSTYSVSNEHHLSGSTAVTNTFSTSSASKATSSQSNLDQGGAMVSHSVFNQGHNFMTGYNEAADVSGSSAQEQGALIWPTGREESSLTSLGSLLEAAETNAMVASEHRNFDGASQSQMQVSWEEQYPGWYYDYQAQQWRQVTAEPFAHSSSSNLELSESQGDSLMKPIYELNTNQSADRLEESRALYGTDVSSQATSASTLSFQAWGAPAVTATFNDPGSGKTGNVKEALQLENEWSSYGVQSYSNVAAQYIKEAEAPSNSFYDLQHHNQSHSFYKPAIETQFSPDERPSHALVAFGFGGRLVTMKASSNSMPETVVVHDLNQVVQTAADGGRNDGVSYFSSLNRGGLAGPLVGGGLATKEVLKWIDDRIANCETEDSQHTESLRVLWGVLRIACVHYGKVRPTNVSSSLKTSSEDGPELDLGRLLSSSSGSPQMHGASAGLQSTPSETQLQSIALELRKRLLEGKRKEALQIAQQGHLWGPALVLASHLGEQAYAETILQMSQQQFVPGCPLRTLFLLLGGQTAELFSTLPLPSQGGAAIPMKDSAGGMLGDWMGNLSIIAANPTNGDEQVITHLGDCLWKDHGEVAGAHTCYLVADTAFESFSENARLCLLGADHFKWQRTFATPMSIQRTELYEYVKALGNPQFILLPFQPYKLVYACMLVEAGRVSEARRYCQAVSKALKNAGRSSEIEFCRQAASAMEERLRVHSQGGYNLNSATGKFVGKFIGTLDNTLHRIMGGLPPRQASEPSLNKNPRDWYQKGGNPAKGREGSMLDPSMQNDNSGRFNNWQTEAPARSVSEPNLSWSPKKKEHNATSSSQGDDTASKENKSEVRRTGYLGRWLSTAVGFIKPNAKKADLGDNNKFYYNKELKRWVEEGVEQLVQETTLAPPPITTNFGSITGNASLDTKATAGAESPNASVGSISSSLQMPPLPPSGNQYSARGRLNGVRARYVDTFNKKGTLPAKSTDAPPLVATSAWGMVPPPTQFFMPVQTATPTANLSMASDEKLLDSIDNYASVKSFEGFNSHNFAPVQVPSMQSSHSPDDSNAESGMNLENYMHTAKFPLPVPPVIEPQAFSMGVENTFFSNIGEHTETGVPSNVHGGILTDMQEVEL